MSTVAAVVFSFVFTTNSDARPGEYGQKNNLPIEGEPRIYSAICDQSDDYDNLINAARKAVEHGYRVLLHMTADYNLGTLARSIKRYFELNPYAREVLVYKGKKQMSVTRKSLEDTNFFRTFIRRYTK